MSLELSRLEVRELLHNLDINNCDPDTVQKLADYVGVQVTLVKAPTQVVTQGGEDVAKTAQVVLASDYRPRESGVGERPPKPPPGDEPEWMMHLDPQLEAQGWTEEEIKIVNQQRVTAMIAARNAAEANPGTSVSGATMYYPPGYGIRHTSIGKKNAAGDTCIKIDVNGHSIFRCGQSEEHGGYADENPVRTGCPKCFIGGGGGTAQPTKDRDALAGEETF